MNMSNQENTNQSYQHNKELAEMLDFIKTYDYKGMVTVVAEKLAKEKGLTMVTAKQYVSRTKIGKTYNPAILEMLMAEAKKQYEPIRAHKEFMNSKVEVL
jgi:hypothetical protein